MSEEISTLIEQEDWTLQVWADRYGARKFWVALGPQGDILDKIRDISTGSDIPSIQLSLLFYKIEKWFPVANGDTLDKTLNALNRKLLTLDKDDNWKDVVREIFVKITEVSDNSYGLTLAVDATTFDLVRSVFGDK